MMAVLACGQTQGNSDASADKSRGGQAGQAGQDLGAFNGGSAAAGGAPLGGATSTSGGGSSAGADASCTGKEGPCIDDIAGERSDFGSQWKSSWFLTGCAAASGNECLTIVGTCRKHERDYNDIGAWTLETFPIGGSPGQHYKVTFTFNAIASVRHYASTAREIGGQPNPRTKDPSIPSIEMA